ncbi:lysophosphatidylglycerol acyltransferase 1 [Cricetulus griseus]
MRFRWKLTLSRDEGKHTPGRRRRGRAPGPRRRHGRTSRSSGQQVRVGSPSADRRGTRCGAGPPRKDRTDANVRMAVTVEEAPWLGWVVAKALMRFAFMVANNLVAIPSYICYVILLQPLRVLDSKRFWYIEGLMYKWLLGMVASWGWYAGYTGKRLVRMSPGAMLRKSQEP